MFFEILQIIFGSVVIGVATESWAIGIGVYFIAIVLYPTNGHPK
ncbi:MAG: hypothetical protein AAB795_01465 [Patescibacteria group bacterium]